MKSPIPPPQSGTDLVLSLVHLEPVRSPGSTGITSHRAMSSGMFTCCCYQDGSTVLYRGLLPRSSVRMYRIASQHQQNLIRVSSNRISRISLWTETHVLCCGLGREGSQLLSGRRNLTTFAARRPDMGLYSSQAEKVEFSVALIWNIMKQWQQAHVIATVTVLSFAFLVIPSADAADALKTCSCLLKECRLQSGRMLLPCSLRAP